MSYITEKMLLSLHELHLFKKNTFNKNTEAQFTQKLRAI